MILIDRPVKLPEAIPVNATKMTRNNVFETIWGEMALMAPKTKLEKNSTMIIVKVNHSPLTRMELAVFSMIQFL